MSTNGMKSGRAWVVAGTAVAALGVGAWGVWHGSDRPTKGGGVPQEYSVASLKVQSEQDAGKAMDTMRQAMDRGDLNEEQRRQVFQNMREVWESKMNERVEEYFNTPETERVAVLDRHIDEFQTQMEEWRKRREEQEAQRPKDSPDDKAKSEEQRERWHGMSGGHSREERKERSESRNPDQMARSMTYFSAMHARMTERGMSMPSWGQHGGSPGRT